MTKSRRFNLDYAVDAVGPGERVVTGGAQNRHVRTLAPHRGRDLDRVAGRSFRIQGQVEGHLVSVDGDHLDKLPETLSVGERQRVAIGRALAHEPSIVIADEPTASVDPFAAEKIMSLFIELAEERNITVVVASHAWRHIQRLGLRRLAHHTHRSKDGRTTETVVNG